jgi:hypothetical protein
MKERVEKIGVSYRFTGRTYFHEGDSGWMFVRLPKKMSTEIRALYVNQQAQWGRMPIQAVVNTSLWKTSIWFDTKMGCYLLPIKKEIQLKQSIRKNQLLDILIYI